MKAGLQIPRDHSVVAVVVEWRDRITLFRRSGLLAHDSCPWHRITGFMEAVATPRQ